MTKSRLMFIFAAITACTCIAACFSLPGKNSTSQSETPDRELRVAIAPYQDMAMLMNIQSLGLEKKYNTRVKLITMAWPDLTPAVAASSNGADVAFASLIQFISQEHSLNSGSSDPIVFFYPAYVFKGGGFVSFNPSVPAFTARDLNDRKTIDRFLKFKIAAQKTSSYEMLISRLARKRDIALKNVQLFNIGSEDGLLAAINGSVDVTSAGLTQKNEAVRRGGRVVLSMEDMNQVDIAGFIARKSTLENRRKEIESLLQMWFDSSSYVLSDLPNHSKQSLDYLRKSSSTRYTIDDYRNALNQEFFPRSVADAEKAIIKKDGKYHYRDVVDDCVAYYLETGAIKKRPDNIELLNLQ